MLHNVYLYGHLGEKYGEHFKFDITTAPDAVRAMAANFKEFYKDFKDGFYQVIIGDMDKGTQYEPSMNRLKIGEKKDVHIIPVVGGSKNSGGIKIIAGLALLAPFAWEFATLELSGAGEFFTVGEIAQQAASTTIFSVGGFNVTYGGLASMGLSLFLGGVAQLLTRAPQVGTQSFLFNGALNATKQGTAIPLVYGRFQTGSILVSSGLNTVQLLSS